MSVFPNSVNPDEFKTVRFCIKDECARIAYMKREVFLEAARVGWFRVREVMRCVDCNVEARFGLTVVQEIGSLVGRMMFKLRRELNRLGFMLVEVWGRLYAVPGMYSCKCIERLLADVYAARRHEGVTGLLSLMFDAWSLKMQRDARKVLEEVAANLYNPDVMLAMLHTNVRAKLARG